MEEMHEQGGQPQGDSASPANCQCTVLIKTGLTTRSDRYLGGLCRVAGIQIGTSGSMTSVSLLDEEEIGSRTTAPWRIRMSHGSAMGYVHTTHIHIHTLIHYHSEFASSSHSSLSDVSFTLHPSSSAHRFYFEAPFEFDL